MLLNFTLFFVYIYHCDSVVLFCGMNVHPRHESTVASKVRIFGSNPPPHLLFSWLTIYIIIYIDAWAREL